MSQSNGTPMSAVEELRETRAKLKLARAKRSLALCEMQAKRLQESAVLWDGASAYSDLLDRLRTDDGRMLLAPSTVADRRYGANWPHWRTWQDHSIFRAQSRFLVDTSDIAFGALSGLTSYVVGDGMTHLWVARKGRTPPPSLIDALNEEQDVYARLNDLPGLEQEDFKNSRADGEAFGRSFVLDDGRTEERVVLPEQILEDPEEDHETGSFGIRTKKGDVQAITDYFVCYDGVASEGEWVPRSEMTHIKVNVSRTIKRGAPDYVYETYNGIRSAGRCVSNMVESAAVQAAVSEIRQWDTATKAQVEAYNDAEADYATREPVTGRQVNTQKATPGERRDIPKGMMFVPPPFSQGGPVWIEITRAALRKVGVRWNAPDWLTSGDASGNTFSNALEAKAPFTRRVLRWQGFYSRAFGGRVERAVRNACDAGRVRAEGRTWSWEEITRLCKLQTKAPSIQSTDPLQDTQRNQIRMQAGILSPQHWSQEDGLDYEQQQQNIEDHKERTGERGGGLGLDDDLGGGGGDAPGGGDPFAGLSGGLREALARRPDLREQIEQEIGADIVEAVRTDKRGRKYCIDDSTGRQTKCGPGEAKAAKTHTHQQVSQHIIALREKGLTRKGVAEAAKMLASLTVADLRQVNKALATKAGASKTHAALVAAIKERALGVKGGPAPSPKPAEKSAAKPVDLSDPASLAAAVAEVGPALPDSIRRKPYDSAREYDKRNPLHKVFVSDLYDALAQRLGGASLDDFKSALMKAHQAGAVQLLRDDLNAHSDKGYAQRSEITHPLGGATFHTANVAFVRPKPAPAPKPAEKPKADGATLRALMAEDPQVAAGDSTMHIPDLRKKMGLPKAEFDRLVLGEADADGRLHLAPTNRAGQMSPEELDTYVRDPGTGRYYIGIGFRDGGAGAAASLPQKYSDKLAAGADPAGLRREAEAEMDSLGLGKNDPVRRKVLLQIEMAPGRGGIA